MQNTFIPEKSMDDRAVAVGVCVGRFRDADHFASVVDALSKTVVAAQGAEACDGVASLLFAVN